MPEDKSIYDVYREAGVSAGKYQASLYEAEDVWGRIASSREKSAFKQEQTQRKLDTLMSAVELGSQLYGGHLAKKEFKGDVGEMEKITGETMVKVGKEGKAWGEMGFFEKLLQEPKYKFGEMTVGKEDVTSFTKMYKYGAMTGADVSSYKERFKSMYGEAEETGDPFVPLTAKQQLQMKSEADAKRAADEKARLEKSEGVKSLLEEAGGDKPSDKDIKIKERMDALKEKARLAKETSRLAKEKNILAQARAKEASSAAGGVKMSDESRKKLIGEMGFTMSGEKWGERGPSVYGAQEKQQTQMKTFMSQLQQLGYDVGDVEKDWGELGVGAWGPKTKAAYGQVYKEWESLY